MKFSLPSVIYLVWSPSGWWSVEVLCNVT